MIKETFARRDFRVSVVTASMKSKSVEYILRAKSRRFLFEKPTRIITLDGELTDEDFVAIIE